ncbi:MAG: hypothetical protein JW760_08315 [Spirochaetales bacterium]|nr:hypothetical protein [Spirochaetales bacterium]
MKLKFIVLFVMVVLVFSACDLFSPDRFYTAVDTYNQTEQPLDSNYWRRLYYTGADLNAGDINDQNIVIVENTAYVLGSYYQERDNVSRVKTFGQITLDTLEARSLELPMGTEENLYWWEDTFTQADGDLFLVFFDSEAATASLHLYRYSPVDGLWEDVTLELGATTPSYIEMIHCNDRFFFLGCFGDEDRTHKIFEYLAGEFTEIFSYTLGIFAYECLITTNGTEMIFFDLYDLSFVWRLSTMGEEIVTDHPDTAEFTDYKTQAFLTDSNRLCLLRWDKNSDLEIPFTFDPLILDYVDLDGDLTWKRESYDAYPRLGGDSLEAEMYQNDIYFLPATDWDGSDDLDNEPAELFRINNDDLALENLGSLPLSTEGTFWYNFEITATFNDMLSFNLNVGTIQRPKAYFYNPGAPDGNKWIPLPDCRDIMGITWSPWPYNDLGWYNGKYYTGGVDGSPQTISRCLLEYTPPVF